jgi:oligopeptide transport system permease protein
MIKFILKRFALFVPIVFIVATVVFFLARLAPGGPFDSERDVAPEALAAIKAQYNLDAPLYKQYVDYMLDLVRGDLGVSFKKPSRTVTEWILLRFPISLELGIYGLLVALAIGLTAGVVASLKPNSLQDYIPMSLAMAGICLPTFVLGPLLVLIFALYFQWFPVAGWLDPADKILPSITLGASYAAYIARLARGGMLEVLSQDFIRTARAKGLSEAAVVLKHGLRGGLQPVVSYIGPAAANMLSGSFVIETVFQVPGLGREFVRAAFNRDYTMILGTVLFYAVLILLFNLIVDVVLAMLDPRVRHEHA